MTLLAARADKEEANRKCSTQLYIAAEQGHTKITDMLVAAGPWAFLQAIE